MSRRDGWKWVWRFLAAAPALIPLYLIARFGTNFPFWDEWDPDIAGIYVKAHQGQLTFADLAAQHNEHRILVPRLIYLIVNSITHWNTIVIMLCGWVVACATSAGILWLIRRTLSRSNSASSEEELPPSPGPEREKSEGLLALWFLCNVVLFMPQQWENWIWGMGLANLMPAMFLVGAVIVAYEKQIPSWLRLVLLVLLCSAATYTTGTGVVIWPLVGMVLVWSRSWKEMKSKIWMIGVLFAGFILNVALYFIGYETPKHAVEQARAGDLEVTVGKVLQFFLAFLGSSFGPTTHYPPLSVATFFGACMLVMFIGAAAYCALILRRQRPSGMELLDRLLIWFIIAGYSLCAAALAAATRVRFGVAQAITPRYVSFGLYVPLALVPICAIVFQDIRERIAKNGTEGSDVIDRWLTRVAAALFAIMLLPPLLSWGPIMIGCASWQGFIARSRGVLLLAKILPDNPQLATHVNPNVAGVLENVPVLNQIGYIHPALIETSSADQIAAPANARSNSAPVGRFEKMWRIENAPQFACSGWAVVPSRGALADLVFLTYDNEKGQPIIFATASQDAQQRPELVQAFGEPGYVVAGWIAIFPNAKIPSNLPKVQLSAWAMDSSTGRAYRLEGGIVVQQR